jgi:hypothetical protein
MSSVEARITRQMHPRVAWLCREASSLYAGNTDDYMAAMDLPPTDSESGSEVDEEEEKLEASSSHQPSR